MASSRAQTLGARTALDLFCGTTRSLFGPELAFDAFLFFDDRGLAYAHRPAWSEREPLLVYHGSLYKAATPSYLTRPLNA